MAINNYYAGSLNPEEELAQAFSSEEMLARAATSERAGEVPVVKAAGKSAYDNVAISRVSNYVNVRSEANTTSAVVGKIYNNCAATDPFHCGRGGRKVVPDSVGKCKGLYKSSVFYNRSGS